MYRSGSRVQDFSSSHDNMWILLDISADIVRIVDVVPRPLCPACASAVLKASMGPTQAAHGVQREWKMTRCAYKEVTAMSREAISLIPLHGRARELKAEVEMLHGMTDLLLQEVCDKVSVLTP